ncbi:MAG: hypothetical protein FWD09_02080 [Lentimicrobiaceae bacterium]|nr:hypothetical protein [Lentimicrobiaceae bacterium]
MISLVQFINIPLESSVLQNLMNSYKFPRNKVSALEKRGQIIRLKKGLYVVSEKISRQNISRELIANHLYGPSYLSLETALSFYGMIPERVFAIRSMTTKRAKNFETPFGNFDYTTISSDYFSIGISQEIVENKYAFLIATPEKALCDLILATPNLRLQSVKAMRVYLEEDLRIDFSDWQNIDTEIIKKCAETGKKKNELKLLLKLLQKNNYE